MKSEWSGDPYRPPPEGLGSREVLCRIICDIGARGWFSMEGGLYASEARQSGLLPVRTVLGGDNYRVGASRQSKDVDFGALADRHPVGDHRYPGDTSEAVEKELCVVAKPDVRFVFAVHPHSLSRLVSVQRPSDLFECLRDCRPSTTREK